MPYSSGTWIVKAGREDEFTQAWGEFAAWTVDEVDGALWAVLLKDEADPRRFVSIGPWETRASIEAWRQLPEFKAAFGDMMDMVESVDVHVLDAAFEIGGAAPDV